MATLQKLWLLILSCFCCTLLFAQSNANEKSDTPVPKDKDVYSLLDVYQLAYNNNAQFKADMANFRAQKQDVPMALGALLPSITATFSFTENYSDPVVFTDTDFYQTYGPEINLSQVLFDWSAWNTYTAAEYTLKANAISLAQKQQQLIQNTISSYLAVLNNQELLKFSRASEKWNKNLYQQSLQKYKIGTVPISDMQSAKANYEQAKAQTIQDRNQLLSSIYNLKQLTSITITKVRDLKESFPFNKPQPDSVKKWLDIAMQENLAIVQNEFLHKASKEKIDVAWGKFFPSLAGTASYSKTTMFDNSPDSTGQSSSDSIQPNVVTGGIQANWNLVKGGADYASLKQSKFLAEQAKFNLEQSKLTTESNLKQAYLGVESDISIIEAFEQSVIAGKYSVETMKAQYEVGTSTIVDLLNQQQQYVQSQQQLANAKYQYLNDLIKLKYQAGTLTIKDVKSINDWLQSQGSNPLKQANTIQTAQK